MPLLQDGQDPDGLAARVAYHLHKLNIGRAALEQAGITQDVARQLRQGSLPLTYEDVRSISGVLQRDPEEFLRPLTEDEKAEWTFYRQSARQVSEVWRRVAEASTAHNYSQRQLGELLELSPATISLVLSGARKTPVLSRNDAMKIADALQLPDGADTFILGLFPQQNAQER